MGAAEDLPRWAWALADDYPMSLPPDGIIPDFEHPKLVGYHSITIACSTSIALLFLFSGARLYAKLCIIRKTNFDDYMFWISLPTLVTLLCLNIYLDNYGVYGYHEYEVKIRALTKPMLVVTFLGAIFLPLATISIKVTLFSLILSVFKTVRIVRYLCYVGIFVTFGCYIPALVLAVIACHPRGGHDRIAFLSGMASYRCASTSDMIQQSSIATGTFNIVTDVYLLVVPLHAIAKLNISRKKKIGVYMIFSAGGIACVASIISLVFRCRAWGSKDYTVDAISLIAANLVEISIGLMVTCMGPVWVLIRTILARHFPFFLSARTSNIQPCACPNPMEKRPKHQKGGLSEILSMKTFGTTVDSGVGTDISSNNTPIREDSV